MIKKKFYSATYNERGRVTFVISFILASSRTRWRRRPFLAVLSHLKTLDLPDYDPIISRIKSQKDQNAKSQIHAAMLIFFFLHK